MVEEQEMREKTGKFGMPSDSCFITEDDDDDDDRHHMKLVRQLLRATNGQADKVSIQMN